MFCPSCGSKNSVEQKFCRSCGMNLETSAASLRDQFPAGSHAELQRQERNLERFGNIAFTGFGLVVVLAVCAMVYWVLSKMVLSGEEPVAGILLINFLIFAALTLAYVVWRESLKEKREKLGRTPIPAPNEAPPSEIAAPTANLLSETTLDAASSMSSVVEETTKSLAQKRRPPR